MVCIQDLAIEVVQDLHSGNKFWMKGYVSLFSILKGKTSFP